MSRFNRRDFLKVGAAATAGYWVSGGVSRAIADSANDKLNVACIGVGGKGGFNLDQISKITNIVAVCDINSETVGKAKAKFPKAEGYADFRKMLETQKNIDAVVVSTPDHTHANAAIMAMRMGKHCYCEKPLTRTIAQARLMAKTAAETKVATQMGNQGHSNDSLRQIVEVLRSGVLGPIRETYTWTDRPGKYWKQGMQVPTNTPPVPENIAWDLWLGPAADRPYSPEYMPFRWRGWWDFGTGSLGDMGCHIFDPVYWGLDLHYPTAVEAVGEPLLPQAGPLNLTAKFEFPARGDMPAVTCTWMDAGNKPSQEVAGEIKLASGGSLIIGDEGKMVISGDYGNSFKLYPEEKFKDYKAPEPTLPRAGSKHYDEFVNAAKSGGTGMSNFAYGARLTETILLGNVAFRVGEKIYWDAENMKATNCPKAEEFIHGTYRKGWELG